MLADVEHGHRLARVGESMMAAIVSSSVAGVGHMQVHGQWYGRGEGGLSGREVILLLHDGCGDILPPRAQV
jgi:hypothetical protein